VLKTYYSGQIKLLFDLLLIFTRDCFIVGNLCTLCNHMVFNQTDIKIVYRWTIKYLNVAVFTDIVKLFFTYPRRHCCSDKGCRSAVHHLDQLKYSGSVVSHLPLDLTIVTYCN